jgi:hypothetical protein
VSCFGFPKFHKEAIFSSKGSRPFEHGIGTFKSLYRKYGSTTDDNALTHIESGIFAGDFYSVS